MTTSPINTPAPALIVIVHTDGENVGSFGPFATTEERDSWVIRAMLDWPRATFTETRLEHPDSV